MSFSDVFKSGFLENVMAVSILDMVLAMVLAFALGLFIFFIYKKTYAGVMYSSSFGVTLVALSMITTLVILAVTSNVVLSLGMVGALSIVRFRASYQGTAGYRVSFLGNRGRHRAGSRNDPACRLRKCDHRPDHSGLRQSQGTYEPLYRSAAVQRP